tara:strand:+ start:1555 stop:1737 length:183 start_codon:yes stop_codon:yes gene_type:complete
MSNYLPELIHTTPNGGTIHKYQLSGGKREFTRFLSCYLGTCQFFGDLEEATVQLKKMEPS